MTELDPHRGPKHIRDGRIHIFTDGSASTHDGSGGWGVLLIQGEREVRISGSKMETTVGEMEMMAVLEGLRKMVHFELPVIFYIDSQYVVKSITIWWRGWKHNGWITASGKPVKHVPLIQEILALSIEENVAFRWIKGHAGIWGNEEADKLAGGARRAMLKEAKL